MLTYKDYNLKLAQLRNTRKLTQTMKMVSANKFHKAQVAQLQASQFAAEYRQVLAHLLQGTDVAGHPFFQSQPEVGSIWVLVCTSDRGLCGGFNSGLCRYLLNWLETEAPGKENRPVLAFWGRRGKTFFQDRFPVAQVYVDVGPRPMFTDACRIGQDLQSVFLDGTAHEVYVAFNEFVSPLNQTPTLKRILPVELPATSPAQSASWMEPIFDPPATELVWPMVSRFINLQIQAAMLDTAAGEHAARMRAMDNATRNADQVIEETQLLRNRARQFSITRELIEIVAGAEALKS